MARAAIRVTAHEENKMALSTFTKMIQDAGTQYNSAKAALSRDNIVRALGEVVPEGWAVVVAGTTPYFNDGSPCRFGFEEAALVSTAEYKNLNQAFVGEHADEDMWEVGPDRKVFNLCDDDHRPKAPDAGLTHDQVDAVYVTWAAVSDDEILQAAFGGNFRVAILAGGEIKKFSHDRGY